MNLGLSQANMSLYHNVIEQMPQIQKSGLLGVLSQLGHIGVESFGYRVIDHHGMSAVFSTCDKWLSLPYNTNFHDVMVDHMNKEVMMMLKNQQQFITRSQDKINSEYLSILTQYEVNNSVVVYKFHPEKIELFFLFANSAEKRDIILNNLPYISTIINTLDTQLHGIANSHVFLNDKKKLLSEQVIQQVFRQQKLLPNRQRGKLEVKYANQTIFLSVRELHCFSMVGLGLSNKSIAIKMGISDLTVKDYITMWKQIFTVGSRDMLSELARSRELRYITQIINENS